MSRQQISVILPTFNRLARLKCVLEGLERQDFPKDRFEVIAISDGSTDGTNESLRSYQPGFRFISIVQTNQGPAAARNVGLAAALGDVIVFIDDDVVPSPRLLSEHYGSIQSEAADVAVIGPMLSPPGFRLDYWTRWSQEKLAEQYDDMVRGRWEPSPRQFYTGNASFPRRLYVRYGGFDQAYRRAEDVEMAYRYARHGVKFHFNPNAIGYHYEERSFAAWTAIAYHYGSSDVQFASMEHNAWIMPLIGEEFHKRNFIIRWAVRACLDHPASSRNLIHASRQIARLGDRCRIGFLHRMGCSIIFNLNYYQGLADRAGGREAILYHFKDKTTPNRQQKAQL